MRLHLLRCLLLLQFYFHIAHQAFLSHTHFTFYCCTPVNLLKPSRSIIRGMRMRKPPLNNRNSSLFETLQYALPSLPSVVVPWHPRTPPHHLPRTLSVARSAAFATAALPQPASIHTLLPLAPSAACVVEPAHMDAECRNSRLRNVLLTPPCLRVAHLAGEAEEVDT